jgi:hypothetical protein
MPPRVHVTLRENLSRPPHAHVTLRMSHFLSPQLPVLLSIAIIGPQSPIAHAVRYANVPSTI